MVKPLTVYKASAGSGKTFTLAVEYIKLLIQNPLAYRQTLAVTFTNKATGEMKQRILSQLYGIWRNLDDSKPYIDKICQELDITPAYASKQAGIALHLLLHNYSYFRVETIDSFFQSVLRNLARELDLTANLRVSLNDYQVEEQAVDQLIENLSATDLLLQWLLKYIMENISDDKSWNVIGQIKQFGKTIFKDFYKKESKELNMITHQKQFFDSYTGLLRKERQAAKDHMKQIADSFFNIIQSNGLSVDDFANKSRGVCSIFIKLRMQQSPFDETILTKQVLEAASNTSKWYTKSSPKADFIHALVDKQLNRLLIQAIAEQPKQWKRYQSATLTLRHLNQLRLLSSIEEKVRDLNETSNRFLLSDTQQLLHELIEGSDSPFIFEKIGARLEHIMIDEFQDTSTVQWKNFKVLLEEAMSHEDASNLIVGDVKQSIYRWRSGDWKLLAHITEQFPNPDQQLDIKPLDTNYRSLPNIIKFNNAFFTEAAKMEAIDAYNDVCQKWVDDQNHHGRVTIELLPKKDYQERVLQTIVDHISELIEKGAPLSDIAILVRINSQMPLIANHITKQLPGISVISDEAFRLGASLAVQTIIQALQYLIRPDDMIAKAFLAKSYTGRIDGELPESFTAHTDQLIRQPLYDITEQIYDIFHLDRYEDQCGYLCAFYDQVAKYVSDYSNDIHAFLKEWNNSIANTTIQCPTTNGIRILSIHKSKGLEFNHVIIPFCDWKLEMPDVIWCKPSAEPYNKLPIVPIDYSQKGMKGSIYEQDYNDEHQQNVVDNLNLLYVAFTRASHNLFVIGKRGAKSTRSELIETVLPSLSIDGNDLDRTEQEDSSLVYTFGESIYIAPQKTKKEKESPNPILRSSTMVPTRIYSYQQKATFKQSNKSKQFALADDDDEEKTRSNYIQLGNILHNVFAHIHTIQDVEEALRQLELEGIIYDNYITVERLGDMIKKRLSHPQVADWFSPHWRIFNECTILLPDGQERRPDRVITDGNRTIVIDFKFGAYRDEYMQQVKEYMSLLQQMGHHNIQGFLWFVYSNKITEIK